MILAKVSDIAAALRKSRQAINKTAKTNNWQAIGERVQGGGELYDIAEIGLTKKERAKVKRYLDRLNPKPASEEETTPEDDYPALWAYYDRKPERTKQEAQRKLAVITEWEALVQSGMDKCQAYRAAAEASGDSWQTVSAWVSKVARAPKENRLPLLVDQYAGRISKADCDKEAWKAFKGDYLRRAKPTGEACYDRLTRSAKEHGWIIPSLKTLLRRLDKEVGRAAIVLAREGADAVKLLFPDQERDHSVFHAMEAVNGDGYTFWPHVDFGGGVICRPTAWVWQDIYSSRILAFRRDVSENTEIIRLSIGDLVETYGIPKHFWIDNTRAAANKTVTGGLKNRYRFKVRDEDPMGIIPMLGSEGHWATPGHGQAKPIERAFGVGGLSEYVDKHPAWDGRGTKARPVPLAEFDRILADEIAAWNARTGRTGREMYGRSFDQVFSESFAQATIPVATLEQRRLWLLACDNVTCHRDDGSITIKFYNTPDGQNRYWNECLSKYAGRKITARFDPQALRDAVQCYTLDGRYIGAAQCIIAAGFNDQDAAREHARARNSFKKAVKATLQAERTMTALEAAAKLPPTAAADIPDPAAVRPVFGKPTKAEVNAAIKARRTTAPQEHGPEMDALRDKFFSRLGEKPAEPAPELPRNVVRMPLAERWTVPVDAYEKFMEWQRINIRMVHGPYEGLSEDEALYWKSFQNTKAWGLGMKMYGSGLPK